MNRLLLLTLLLTFTYSLQAQPFAIGSTTITFSDPSRGNRAIETDIYYPATTAGVNSTPAGSNGEKFPVIVFGHGFVMTVSAYQNIWSALVPAGYIVALPKTEGGILPNHTNFGKDLAYIVTALINAGNSSGNLLFNKVSNTSAVMGHSMGGGASFLAVQYNPSITTVVGLAPAETNPAASSASQNISIPALIFAGGNDCVTPAGQHSQLIYNSVGADCKSYINIIGGSHCQFANSNFNCSFGEATCSPGPSISRATQQSLVIKYLLPFLDYRLKNKCAAWLTMQSLLVNDTAIALLQNCIEPTTCTAPVNRQVTNLSSTSVKLSWRQTACVNKYQIRYRKSNFSTPWIVKNAGNTTFYTLNSLQSGTTYDWQVRVRCDSSGMSLSNWGSLKQFTTTALRTEEENSSFTQNEPGFEFSIGPNPGHGLFQIEFQGEEGNNYSSELINMLGISIRKSTFSTTNDLFSFVLDYTDIPSGIYIYKISDGLSTVTRRLIIQ